PTPVVAPDATHGIDIGTPCEVQVSDQPGPFDWRELNRSQTLSGKPPLHNLLWGERFTQQLNKRPAGRHAQALSHRSDRRTMGLRGAPTAAGTARRAAARR